MNDTPEIPAASPASPSLPPPRNSPIGPPPPRRLDPAAVMIGVGGVVLALAVWWLLVTPRSSNDGGVDPARVAQLEQRLGALEGLRGEVGTITGRIQQLAPLEGRIQTLEGKPAPAMPDLRPLEGQLAGLVERLAVSERGAAQANDRAGANERRLQAIESKPAIDPATMAPRAALDALGTRVERLAERAESQTARLQDIAKADETRDAAAQQAVTQRLDGLDGAVQQKLGAFDAALQQKLGALDAAQQQKLAALDTALGQRIAALEQAQQKLTALEGRTARLAAIDRLRGALTAGQPLGEGLGRIDQPPQALARFATAAPPTEAGLRLSFEDSAKAARAASDAAMQPDGSKSGVMDSAVSRLSGLVTVRRGEQVVWGDAAEAEIERARRALEAGDLEMSLTHIGKLPPPARDAMQPWADQARALIAARAALRQLAAG